MTTEEILSRLAAPFPADAVKFRAAVVSGNRALAVPYLNAGAVQDRLDEVLGVAGWNDEYDCLPDGSVVCRLTVKVGDERIIKMDVGSAGDQGEAGDRRKAAFADALRRAALKFRIGHSLTRLEAQWCDWDPQQRKFAKTPRLPAPQTA